MRLQLVHIRIARESPVFVYSTQPDVKVVLQQGDRGSTFYILYEGEVAVCKDGHEVLACFDSHARRSQYFPSVLF